MSSIEGSSVYQSITRILNGYECEKITNVVDKLNEFVDVRKARNMIYRNYIRKNLPFKFENRAGTDIGYHRAHQGE